MVYCSSRDNPKNWDCEEQRKWKFTGNPPCLLVGKACVEKGCLPEFGTGTQQPVGETSGDCLCDPQ